MFLDHRLHITMWLIWTLATPWAWSKACPRKTARTSGSRCQSTGTQTGRTTNPLHLLFTNKSYNIVVIWPFWKCLHESKSGKLFFFIDYEMAPPYKAYCLIWPFIFLNLTTLCNLIICKIKNCSVRNQKQDKW